MIETLKLSLEAITKYLSECPDPSEEAVEGLCDAASAARAAIAKAEKQSEPVAWMHCQGNFEEAACRPLDEDEILRGWTQKPLYTTPQQRTWVGLTNEEMNDIWSDQKRSGESITRAIEAKLKEKNT